MAKFVRLTYAGGAPLYFNSDLIVTVSARWDLQEPSIRSRVLVSGGGCYDVSETCGEIMALIEGLDEKEQLTRQAGWGSVADMESFVYEQIKIGGKT